MNFPSQASSQRARALSTAEALTDLLREEAWYCILGLRPKSPRTTTQHTRLPIAPGSFPPGAPWLLIPPSLPRCKSFGRPAGQGINLLQWMPRQWWLL